jgi:hypothetical protein
MKKKELLFAIIISCVISAVFFYKTILFGQIPFPGDLLIAEYAPWKTYTYLGYNPGSYPNKAQYFDTLRQLYPWKTMVVEALQHGQLPLWNPYSFSGAPLLANFQSAALYPLNVLYLVMPQVNAWAVTVFLQVCLAFIFTYLYTRKIGLSKFGSMFSAIGYGGSSFMTVWLEYNTVGQVILWLPAVLLSLEYLQQNITARWFILGVIALTMALTAGHPQVFGYLYVFSFVYAIWLIKRGGKSRMDTLVLWLLFFLLPLGIASVQLLPGLELIQHAARSDHDYTMLVHKILIQPWQLIMMIIPDFFGNPASRNYYLSDTYVGKMTGIGLIPFLFALYSLRERKNRKSYSTLFLMTAIVTLVLSTNNPVTASLYLLPIPFFSSSSPTLSMFLFSFSLALLSGIGVDYFMKSSGAKKHLVHLVLPGAVFFIVCWVVTLTVWKLQLFGVTPEHAMISLRNLLVPTMLFLVMCAVMALVWMRPRLRTAILFALFFLSFGESFRAFQKFNPFVTQELVFPEATIISKLQNISEHNRFYGYGSAGIQANFASQYKLFSPEGYDPLYPRHYGEFIHASADGNLPGTFSQRTRSDAFIASGEFTNNIYTMRIIDTLGVKYILDRIENGSTEKTFPSDRFSFVSEENGWKIFENKRAIPRAFFAYGQMTYTDQSDFEKKFFSTHFDPQKIILMEEAVAGVAAPSPQAEVQIQSFQPERVVIKTVNDVSSLLYVSDTYYPGWKARVDGKEMPIYKANYAFRAIAVPAGKHSVVFSYEPRSLTYGIGISLISIVVLFACSLVIAIKRPKTFI